MVKSHYDIINKAIKRTSREKVTRQLLSFSKQHPSKKTYAIKLARASYFGSSTSSSSLHTPHFAASAVSLPTHAASASASSLRREAGYRAPPDTSHSTKRDAFTLIRRAPDAVPPLVKKPAVKTESPSSPTRPSTSPSTHDRVKTAVKLTDGIKADLTSEYTPREELQTSNATETQEYKKAVK